MKVKIEEEWDVERCALVWIKLVLSGGCGQVEPQLFIFDTFYYANLNNVFFVVSFLLLDKRIQSQVIRRMVAKIRRDFIGKV